MLTLTEIIDLSHKMGQLYPEAYMEDNWMPHNWVVAAIQHAYEMGRAYATPTGDDNV